jgi:hypothetical protein
MRLNTFFNGKLGREELSSAFLACLIQQRDDFRSFFFQTAGLKEMPENCQVGVEIDNVDIRLDCPDNRSVLIEVKVRKGSIQPEQLNLYFNRLRERDPNKQISFIMVVPTKGGGAAEIKRLQENAHWRANDYACAITWDQLSTFAEDLSKYDRDESFISSGFEMIQKMIEAKGGSLYSNAGGRDIVVQLARSIIGKLEKEFNPVKFQVWLNQDFIDISPYGSQFSPSLRLWFDTPLDENGVPITPITQTDVRLRAEPMYGISNKGKHNPLVSTEWKKMCALGTMSLPPGITYQLKGRWYSASTALAGTADEVETKALNLISPLVERFKDLMLAQVTI